MNEKDQGPRVGLGEARTPILTGEVEPLLKTTSVDYEIRWDLNGQVRSWWEYSSLLEMELGPERRARTEL